MKIENHYFNHIKKFVNLQLYKLQKIREMGTEFILVLTTIEKYLNAVQIAKVLIAEKLAACCTILQNATSFYEWQGALEDRKENVLLIKTTKVKFEALRNRIVELHTDKVPEIISVKIDDGLKEYLSWVEATTM